MPVSLFEDYCKENSLPVTVIQSEITARTAQEAADAHGVDISAIVKSLLLIVDGSPKLFLVPGHIRLDLDAVKASLEADEVKMAGADQVKKITGHSIGGVPPFGHKEKIDTYIVKGFQEDSEVIPAAGHHQAVFRVQFSDLVSYSGAEILDLD